MSLQGSSPDFESFFKLTFVSSHHEIPFYRGKIRRHNKSAEIRDRKAPADNRAVYNKANNIISFFIINKKRYRKDRQDSEAAERQAHKAAGPDIRVQP